MRHYETAFWDSELSDNEPFEKWEAAGSADAAMRANKLWKKRLAEFEAPALDIGLRDGLSDYIARKKAGMADAWY
jgi:trimethylamine---corrinoid protein Co-methyltransferase